ncbi:MAG: hypothetical protein HYW56_00715 [Candidatus Harrisonbacteria bacterium]|nr:hypothetical protein [Candidatus Harrisonbacteria bacterium]
MRRTIVLAVLDGYGIGTNDDTNPIYLAEPQTINYIRKNYLSGALQASGIAVGLPWGEEGNSEVGHLTLGAGKVIYQHFPRISLAIKDKSFFTNEVLAEAFARGNNGARVHLIGLLTEGSVHASFAHLEALVQYAKNAGVKNLSLHLFTDGKDSAPRSAPMLLKKISAVLEREGVGEIASIGGRFYGMDRDEHYDRTKKRHKRRGCGDMLQLPRGQHAANRRSVYASRVQSVPRHSAGKAFGRDIYRVFPEV